jgi:hypothetical protein
MRRENGKSSTSSMWRRPVCVKTGHGMAEPISGPEEALDCLLNRWPTASGHYYGLAKLTCVGALEQYNSFERARECFTAAAVEVDILA